MTAAAALYVGRTTHARLTPFVKRFRYSVASLLIDIDRLEEADTACRLFSVDKPNVFSFHRRDHGERADQPLRPWAERALAQAGVALEGGPIWLLTLPRMLGYVFNPLSLWLGHGPAGELRGVVYEVNNTFGDAHAYVAPILGQDAPARHCVEKTFHVSPFFPRRGRYDFRLSPPAKSFALSIRYSIDGEDALVASQTGERRPLADRELLKLLARSPLMTVKVIAAIHMEALGLWRRGARYHGRPAPAAPVSVAQSDSALCLEQG